MKKRWFIAAAAAAFLILAPASLACQTSAGVPGLPDGDDGEGATSAQALGLSDKELDAIEEVLSKKEDAIALARAEIQIVQAKIARALLDDDPKAEDIKPLVKESLDSELKVRMIQIERQLAIRRLIGAKRWAAWVKLMRSPWSRGNAGPRKIKNARIERLERLRAIMDRLR